MNPIRIKDRYGQAFHINHPLLKLGRALDNDIVLTDLSISRYHLALQPIEDGLVIFNTGSDSGFHINNDWFIDSAVARAGDILRVGAQEFVVDIEESLKTQEFAFTTSALESSRTGSLDVNSKNKKIRIVGALVLLGMMGMLLLPEDKKEELTNRDPASENNKATRPLPSESYGDAEVPLLGPQELTAEDLYKRGMREVSNKNQIRAIQFFQQSLVEDPSLAKSRNALSDAELSLQNRTDNLVMSCEKNFKDNRLQLSRSQANQVLDLLSEQIPGYSYKVQQTQRTLASQKLPVLSREQMYLTLACDQSPNEKLCQRAVEILKKSRLKLGEENVLK